MDNPFLTISKIYTRKDKYGERESLLTDEQFGSGLCRCYQSKEKSFKYFDELTNILKLLQGVPKFASG
ncbi:MAG: hypothetical protein ACM3RX_06050 [Methanococcaceae archaeon]